jgi:hypothetical protein
MRVERNPKSTPPALGSSLLGTLLNEWQSHFMEGIRCLLPASSLCKSFRERWSNCLDPLEKVDSVVKVHGLLGAFLHPSAANANAYLAPKSLQPTTTLRHSCYMAWASHRRLLYHDRTYGDGQRLLAVQRGRRKCAHISTLPMNLVAHAHLLPKRHGRLILTASCSQ